MKQLLQSLNNGETFLETLPIPNIDNESVLIKTKCTLVSLGTEKMLVEFGKANLVQKARQQPEKVKKVLDKIKTEGLTPTLEKVFAKLEQPIPLGYCNVGEVISVGNGVTEFSVGDRVASNGPHAEIVSVSKNLVAHIPEEVSYEEAAFTVIGSIGLQGIRLLNPSMGETIVVYGLGLIGLISCQLLKANGCNVIGIDLDAEKCKIAKNWNITVINPRFDNLVTSVMESTNDMGADGVLITASTKSNDIISQAAKLSRKRGKIILVGVIGLAINRSDFYEKELSFQVSCSYGPGRYDDQYEKGGIDYPFAYVRWTEKRNFEAILEILRTKSLDVTPLISKRVEFENFNEIYNNIDSKNIIASLLIFSDMNKKNLKEKTLVLKKSIFSKEDIICGIIGAGNFTSSTLLPVLNKTQIKVKKIASNGGLSGTLLAKKFGINEATTEYKEIITDKKINTVIIATRHQNHAQLVIESLNEGKNVFVEKPLAINFTELRKIKDAYKKNPLLILSVGFNRRFSPHLREIKKFLGENSKNTNIIATMNAGAISRDHWTQNFKLEGGRIIGEACHLIDACVFLLGSLVKSVCMTSLGENTDLSTDNVSILLKFHNGSNGVINYFSNGSRKYMKERIEIHSKSRTWVMDNYQKTQSFGVPGFKTLKTKIDKGHSKQFLELFKSLKENKSEVIPVDQIFNVTEASLLAIQSIEKNKWVSLDEN